MASCIFRVKPLVAAALGRSPAARDNVNALILEVWRQCGLEVTENIEELASRLPQAETIRRERARIQNEQGRFPPSPEVLARRLRHIRRGKDRA